MPKSAFLKEPQLDINFRVKKFSFNWHDPNRDVPHDVLRWASAKSDISQYISAAENIMAENPTVLVSSCINARYRRSRFSSETQIQEFMQTFYTVTANLMREHWAPEMAELSFDLDFEKGKASNGPGAGEAYSKLAIPDVVGFITEESGKDAVPPILFIVGAVKTPEFFCPSKGDPAPDLADMWARGQGMSAKH